MRLPNQTRNSRDLGPFPPGQLVAMPPFRCQGTIPPEILPAYEPHRQHRSRDVGKLQARFPATMAWTDGNILHGSNPSSTSPLAPALWSRPIARHRETDGRWGSRSRSARRSLDAAIYCRRNAGCFSNIPGQAQTDHRPRQRKARQLDTQVRSSSLPWAC